MQSFENIVMTGYRILNPKIKATLTIAREIPH